MTISRVGGVFFTAVTTVNGVTRERSEYLGGANVQDPPAYICYTNNIATSGSQMYFYNMTGQTSTFGFSTRVTVPVSFPLMSVQGVDITYDNQLIAFGGLTTPRLAMFNLTGGTSPFSSLLTNPSNIGTEVTVGVTKNRFSPLATAITLPCNGTNCLVSYTVTGTTSNPPLGSKLTNPASLPTSVTGCQCCNWHPNGNYLVVGATASGDDGMVVYPVSGSPLAYGTKISISTSGGDFRSVIFSAKGDLLAGGTTGTNTPTVNFFIFPWITNNVGTRISNPIVFSVTTSVAISSDQKYIALGSNVSPFLRVYNWSGSDTSNYSFGSQITITQTAPAGTVREIKWFGVNDRYLIMTSDVAPKANVYIWGANGTAGNTAYKLSDPSVLIANTALDVVPSFA